MKILRYIKTILLAGPYILWNHIFYISRYGRHPEKYPFEKRYHNVRKLIRFVFRRLHVDISKINMSQYENLNEKCMIIVNHYSAADPLLLIAASEKPITFVCKKEALTLPFAGKIIKALECFPLDRSNLMNQISQIRDIVTYLKNPEKPSVIIFIEGTRSKQPEKPCLDFHPGTLKIAQMANVPLYCGAIYGSFRILDKKAYLKRYPVFFDFFKKMETNQLKECVTTELASSLQKETDDYISSLRLLDKAYIENSKNSKKRKLLETRVDVSVNS